MFPKDAINIQLSAFKQWGAMTDWNEGYYYTFKQEYVARQLQL